MKQVRALVIEKNKGALDYKVANDTLNMWLQTCANGRYLLSLKQIREKRSDRQNKLMWLWFNLIAEEWSQSQGMIFTPQDVHDAYCMMYLPISTPKGRIPGSTSKLDTEKMTEFLERVQADVQTEYGIELPTPEESFLDAWAAENS